jgi:proteic killer suppression protein
MLKTVADKTAARIFEGHFVRALPVQIQALAHRKFRLIDSASSVETLRAPPGNRL